MNSTGVPGHCSAPRPPARAGDSACTTGRSGGWPLRGWPTSLSPIDAKAALSQCTTRCNGCARCRYFSYSHMLKQCKWYWNCDAMANNVVGRSSWRTVMSSRWSRRQSTPRLPLPLGMEKRSPPPSSTRAVTDRRAKARTAAANSSATSGSGECRPPTPLDALMRSARLPVAQYCGVFHSEDVRLGDLCGLEKHSGGGGGVGGGADGSGAGRAALLGIFAELNVSDAAHAAVLADRVHAKCDEMRSKSRSSNKTTLNQGKGTRGEMRAPWPPAPPAPPALPVCGPSCRQRVTAFLAVVGFQKCGTTAFRATLAKAAASECATNDGGVATQFNEGCPTPLHPLGTWEAALKAAHGRIENPCGNATTLACVAPAAVENIKFTAKPGWSVVAKMKTALRVTIAIFVREPASRAFSAFTMYRSWGGGKAIVGLAHKLSFDELVRRNIDEYRNATRRHEAPPRARAPGKKEAAAVARLSLASPPPPPEWESGDEAPEQGSGEVGSWRRLAGITAGTSKKRPTPPPRSSSSRSRSRSSGKPPEPTSHACDIEYDLVCTGRYHRHVSRFEAALRRSYGAATGGAAYGATGAATPQLHVMVAERAEKAPLAEYNKLLQAAGLPTVRSIPMLDAKAARSGSYAERRVAAMHPPLRVTGATIRAFLRDDTEAFFAWLGYRIDEWDRWEEHLGT